MVNIFVCIIIAILRNPSLIVYKRNIPLWSYSREEILKECSRFMKHNIQNQSSTVVNKGSSKGLMVITGVTLALSVIGIFAYIRYFSQKKNNNK